MQQHYHAFISYRHAENDMLIAENLQKLLEKYKVTNSETGKKEALTVFRDAYALHASDDLAKEIQTALDASDYLILICSRHYRESGWCQLEIDYFRKTHGNSNQYILPIITDGEPSECFPDAIRFRESEVLNTATGSTEIVRVPVEPLAADVRGASVDEQLKKLKSIEHMRIAAPILGVPFDTLYQHKMRERIWKIVISAVLALVLTAGFGIYNSIMLRNLAEQHRETLKADSRNLAFTSSLLFDSGNRRDALKILRQAFSSETQVRPEVPEAVQKLHEIMYTYQAPAYRIDQVYDGYGNIVQAVLSDDGRYLVTVNTRETAVCYDLQLQTEVWTLTLDYYSFLVIRHPRLMAIGNGSDVLLIQHNDIKRICIATGEIKWERNLSNDFFSNTTTLSPLLSPDGRYLFIADQESSGFAANSLFYFSIVDAETGEELIFTKWDCSDADIPLLADKGYQKYRLGASGFSENGRFFTLVMDHDPSEDCETDFAVVTTIDLEQRAIVSTYTAMAGSSTLRRAFSNAQYVELYPMLDDSGETNGYLYRIKAVAGETDPSDKWSTSASESDRTIYSGNAFLTSREDTFQAGYLDCEGYLDEMFSPDGVTALLHGEEILFVGDLEVLRFSLESGSFRYHVSLPSATIRCFREDGRLLLLRKDGMLVALDTDSLALTPVQQAPVSDAKCRLVAEPKNGCMVLVPDSLPNTALVCRRIGDTRGHEIALSENVNKYTELLTVPLSDTTGVLLGMGRECFMVSLGGEASELIARNTEMNGSASYGYSPKDYQGINGSGTIVLLDSDVWDLRTNTIQSSDGLSWKEWDLTGLSFLAVDDKILPKGFSQEANEAAVLQWWRNGEMVEVPMLYNDTPIVEGIVWSMETWQNDAFLLGSNGLMAAKMGLGKVTEENAFPKGDGNYSGLMVFAAQEQQWRYVPTGADGYFTKGLTVPYSAFAINHRWIATLEQDGVLRVYDWETDSWKYQHDLQIAYASVQYMSFFGDDRYLMLRTDGIAQILDLETGEILLKEAIPSSDGYSSAQAIGCLDYGHHLAILCDDGESDGLWVNTETWLVEDRIPALRYINERLVVVSDLNNHKLLAYPTWDLEDLLASVQTQQP